MNMVARPTPPGAVVYPESDGKPMAENTRQYEWIVTIKENLDLLCRDRPAGFVAADNLVYPVEGHPEICQAPDVYVALGRPRGHRGSYKVWEEGGVFPQVVFEVLSPGNRGGEMARKFRFYQRYGVQEYYIYDPDDDRLWGWRREGGDLEEIPEMNGWVSPLLGIRFDTSGPELAIYRPDNKRFLKVEELADRAARLAAKLRELGVDPDAV